MNLVARVTGLLMKPADEWRTIAAEPVDASLWRYVAIVAAVPVVSSFIGSSIVGVQVPTVGMVRIGLVAGLAQALVGYVLAFISVYLTALVIDALAPLFHGRKDFANALKTAAYFPTPFWLAGVFSLLPALGFLGILGLYGVYLLYVGLPVTMRAPADKAIGYTAAVIACAVVIFIVVAVILAGVVAAVR